MAGEWKRAFEPPEWVKEDERRRNKRKKREPRKISDEEASRIFNEWLKDDVPQVPQSMPPVREWENGDRLWILSRKYRVFRCVGRDEAYVISHDFENCWVPDPAELVAYINDCRLTEISDKEHGDDGSDVYCAWIQVQRVADEIFEEAEIVDPFGEGKG